MQARGLRYNRAGDGSPFPVPSRPTAPSGRRQFGGGL